MASKEVLLKVKALLENSAKTFNTDYITLDSYSPEAISMIFDSMADVCSRAKIEINKDEFNTNIDAIEFSAMIIHCLYRTLNVNTQALALLKQIIQAKKN